jgi:hypothetical protein
MTTLQHLLLWLSKTDPKLFLMCPQDVKWTRTGLGLFVLLTGVFAFITGSYFVSTLFSSYDEQTQLVDVSTVGWIISVCSGALWATMVIMIDREIVSAASKWSAVIRLPLAILLGYTIAIPFKVHFFSDAVNKELTLASRQENKQYEDYMMAQISQINDDIRSVTLKRDKALESRNEWAAIKEAEITGRKMPGRTGIANCGPSCREAGRNEAIHADLTAKYEDEMTELKAAKDSIIISARDEFDQAKINQSYDFISQYVQMSRLARSDKDLAFFALILTIIFIFIETIPAIMKLWKGEDEYDILLEIRRNLNIQIAIANANMALNEIVHSNPNTLSNGKFKYNPKEMIKNIGKSLES